MKQANAKHRHSISKVQSRFAKVPQAQIPRSSFDRTHQVKTTFNVNDLVPVYVDEALPGDTFNLNMAGFARMATPIKPFMDNLYLDTFFFAVPYRLVWDNWEKFNGAQDDPGDSISFVIPTVTIPATGYTLGTLEDYMGIPTEVAPGTPAWTHSALWTRAYNLIWNEWFRDENLSDSVVVSKGDGPDTPGSPSVGTILLRRAKRHDYFTSCLPWPQKEVAVQIPLEGIARVEHDAVLGGDIGVWELQTSAYHKMDTDAAKLHSSSATSTAGVSLQADLSEATNATINSLRQAFQIQKLLERDARGGTRYTEIVKSHFGVSSPDARLQRTEYLGGGTAMIMVSPIAQTSSAIDDPTPQGNLAAIGTGSFTGHGFVKSFTEHCLLIGMVNARADLTYSQGLDRMWNRSTRYDFYWPALAQIGEQAVLNKELWMSVGAPTLNDEAFGYQERYAEYRYKPSRITNLFRPGVTGTLDIWHLSQEFGALPTLNDTFIFENVPINRVEAVPSEPDFLLDLNIGLKCARPMPVFGVPGFVDHF